MKPKPPNAERRPDRGGVTASAVLNLDASSVARDERVDALRRALRKVRAEQRQGLERTTTVALLVAWLSDEQAAA